MDDARVGRYGAEAVERDLAPLQERIAFAVAIELERRVLFERFGGAELIDLDRVIDHEFDRLQRIDLLRIAAHIGHRIAHRGEIDDARDAREILQEHAARTIRDLFRALAAGLPLGQPLDVFFRNAAAVFETNEVLEQDLEAERQARNARMSGFL